MNYRRCLFLAICMISFFFGGKVPIHAKNIQVLLLSGANNHDWRSTTPCLEQLLSCHSDIRVTTTNRPDTLNADLLKGVDVIVSNWNTFPENTVVWNRESRKVLEKFIRGGGGFVTIHAGSCSNYDWDFFLQLTGGRWGKATHHGAISEFEVKVNPYHPITAGIAPFHFRDELWESVEWSPQAEVLCTAQSSTGVDEPVMVVTQIDRGRGFFLVLGHDAETMQQPMFGKLLLKGIRWTAENKRK